MDCTTLSEWRRRGRRRIQTIAQGSQKSGTKTVRTVLNSNGDKKRNKFELTYMMKSEKSIKKDGGLRELIHDVFGILDSDGDDQFSANELLEGSKSSDVIAKVTLWLHELFLMCKTPQELEKISKIPSNLLVALIH